MGSSVGCVKVRMRQRDVPGAKVNGIVIGHVKLNIGKITNNFVKQSTKK